MHPALSNNMNNKHVASCDETFDLLRVLAPLRNESKWNDVISRRNGCDVTNVTDFLPMGLHSHPHSRIHQDWFVKDVGMHIYAYATPFIMCLGLIGNIISTKVFTSKFMTRFSSSYYLVSLSVSDIVVLSVYISLEWLNKGLPLWPGGYRIPLVNKHGFCQTFLYISYTFRMFSVYLIVLFTVERYIVACWQDKKKQICSKPRARNMIVMTGISSCVLCLYKPISSGSYQSQNSIESVCTRHPGLIMETYIMDSIYALLTTVIPFIAITVMNLAILRRLLQWNGFLKTQTGFIFRENRIRLEFTAILLVVSTCFIGLSLPYFIVWCKLFTHSLFPATATSTDNLSGQLHITKTIYYLNYCCNFFLYCVTGAYYRREIRSIFRLYFNKKSRIPTELTGKFRFPYEMTDKAVQLHYQTVQTKCAS